MSEPAFGSVLIGNKDLITRKSIDNLLLTIAFMRVK